MNKLILTLAFSLTALVGFSQQTDNPGWEVGYEDNSSPAFENDNSFSTNSGSSLSGNGVTQNSPEELAIGPGTPTPIDQYTIMLLALGGLLLTGVATRNQKLKNA